MKSIFHYCQGESHKSTDKACQDCAYAESSENLSMAIVCDGHGGERYFRSRYGSEMAVEITKKAICDFVNSMEELSLTKSKRGARSVFDGEPFRAYSAATATDSQVTNKAHRALTWLFSSIISQWNDAIAKDAKERDLDEWELEHVEQKYKDEFLAKRETEDATFEKTYGCTLMAYVQTPEYWFAFHLGDGKCVFMQIEDGKLVCEQPIPWDDRCFLNKTTSLCDSQALEEFRYCYQGNGEFPRAVFLGSDGLDDSYGDGDNLHNFYIEVFKMIIRKGKEATLKELQKSLPLISKVGSKDDMSVACVYDDTALLATFNYLIECQQAMLDEQAYAINQRIGLLKQKIEGFGDPEKLSQGEAINLEYAKKDLEKAQEKAKKIDYKMRNLKGQKTKFQKQYLSESDDSSENEEDSPSLEILPENEE